MHEQTKIERERIIGMIHDFCRGETMIGKGCANCVLNELNVCNEGSRASLVPLTRLKKAEKIINEVLANG
jgi:hypothetical protein